ncbi:MAG: transitional endoplasmic reticulum ATPase [Colwellia sp.]|jgi:transitional endoplasmic reticulum ATPase
MSSDAAIRYLACDVIKKILATGLYDHEFVDEIPKATITQLTGKAFLRNPRNKQEQLELFERSLNSVKQDLSLKPRLQHNVRLIGVALELPEYSLSLLELSVLCSVNFGLYELIQHHLNFSHENIDVMVADVLNISPLELEQATLAIASTPLFNMRASNFLEVLRLPHAIARKVVEIDADCYQELMVDIFSIMPKASLKLRDFPHLELDHLSQYLTITVKGNMQGVNILLYGGSGVGKTELAKTLAALAKAQLISVSAKGNELQNPSDELQTQSNVAHLRLKYHSLIQSMLKNDNRSILLVDEAEDLFHEYYSGIKVSKELLHKTVEGNNTPTIFISNHIEDLPHSFIRRCLCMEITSPPKSIKLELLSKPLVGLRISQTFKENLADIDALTPAHITSASHVAKTIGLTGIAAEHCVHQHIEQTLNACGLQTSTPSYHAELPFDKQFINIKGDMNSIDELIKAVTTFDGTRALLFGVPGTGKTALVNHLAECLEQELITVKCSDVLGKYVSESEKNVARIFRQAQQQNAILFLDEVDSLLSSRSSLTNQFERQLVNEFLQQIEQSELTIFAATNHAQIVDKAALRRFDFKLTLDYLNQQQVLKLYQETVGNISKAEQQQLSQMKQLTAGDFAIVARRNRLSRKPLTHAQNIQLLQEENNRKEKHQSIGFIQ